jgi:uroporphyrinogen-III decarboxylase
MGTLGVEDRAGVPILSDRDPDQIVPGVDEWGCRWAHTDVPNMGQVVGNPLADISKLDTYPFPNYTADRRFVQVEETLQKADNEGKYVGAGIFMVLFERMHTLHGFENTLVDLYHDRPAMEALADRIVDVHVTLVKEMARRFPGRLDMWGMTDDWGTQQGAFISYSLWADFFLPRYARIFDAMHAAGCTVWVHSCGKVNEIIEGYIQAGVDVVNLQQPRALGIEEVGKRYRGRIGFESVADIQTTLPSGDKKMVAADVEALMTHWASAEGGFIFSDYGDGKAIGVADDSIKEFMYDEFSRWSERLYGEPLPQRAG